MSYPAFAEAHYNLENIYRNQGSYKEALNHYKRALEIEPDSAEVLNNLGIVYGIQGRMNQAI
jgi:tetratricopeptide (TPR) repeat protein